MEKVTLEPRVVFMQNQGTLFLRKKVCSIADLTEKQSKFGSQQQLKQSSLV